VAKIGPIRFSLHSARHPSPSRPLQIANQGKTKSSVTSSKQSIGPHPNRYKIQVSKCRDRRHLERAKRVAPSASRMVSRGEGSPFSPPLIAPSSPLIGTPVIRILPISLRTRAKNFSNRHNSRDSMFRLRSRPISSLPRATDAPVATPKLCATLGVHQAAAGHIIHRAAPRSELSCAG
jgi:hypothetical protein